MMSNARKSICRFGRRRKIMSNKIPQPSYEKLHSWDIYSKDLGVEYVQCIEEGKNVTALKELFDAVSKMDYSKEREDAADIIYRKIMEAPQVEGYKYDEPSDLEGIFALRDSFRLSGKELSKEEIKDKVLGAWLGRVCGCLLGKPIEGIRTPDLHPLLKKTGNFPMKRYILASEITDDIAKECKFPLRGRCFADTLNGSAPVDDDTNYTAIGYEILKRFGRGFTPHNVIDYWVNFQGKNAYCTAERVAYRNYVAGYFPPDSAVYKNPYREWIGAQIRGDFFGYINPGDPEAAADMAWRDASISHVKNGIYGEMFASAMIAAAAVSDNTEEVVRAGISQIPKTSRLYEKISALLDFYKAGGSADDFFADFAKRYNEFSAHDWCHTISNAEIVAAALLYGEGDYGKSICLAVQQGFDTDCNGATVGSVIGMMKGSAAVGEEWTAPTCFMLQTSIFGVGTVDIREMAEKTLEFIAT